MSDFYQTPFGRFRLVRYPRRPREVLQAWCAADTLLLEAAAQRQVAPERILVANDEHGALCVPLSGCTSWSDSALTRLAIADNLALNPSQQAPRPIGSSALPRGDFSLVLLRAPKQLALLRWQLQRLREVLPAGTELVCAGMQKHLAPGLEHVLSDAYGPAVRHLAQGKARAYSAVLDKSLASTEPDLVSWHCAELDASISTFPGVFSRDQLDIGTRFLLDQLHAMPRVSRAVDLACGNGVLGLALLKNKLATSVVFADESELALSSAAHNVQGLTLPTGAQYETLHGDGLLAYHGDAPGLIVCNPPFHLQHTVDDFAGRRLIAQASSALGAGGELWLVANRHLAYAPVLNKHFDKVSVYARNRKFTIWQSKKR